MIDALHHFMHALGAFPAGNAFAAGFMFEELGDSLHNIDYIPWFHPLRIPLQSPGCADSAHRVKVDSGIQQFLGMNPPEVPPICTALNFFAVPDAFAVVIDYLTNGDIGRNLNNLAFHHIAGQGQQLGTGITGCTDGFKPIGSFFPQSAECRPGFRRC